MGLKTLFTSIEQLGETEFVLQCSYFEIYNENIYDLLDLENLDEALPIYEDTTRDEFKVKGLEMKDVADLEDCYAVLKEGEKNRHYASTKMNHQSSRSHTVFRVTLIQKKEEEGIEKSSILNFIDLAGSECISVHDKDAIDEESS